MRDFLLEIGVEDIPPRYARSALAQLKENAEKLFEENRLKYSSLEVLGTQRRLVLMVRNLEELQGDQEKVVRGPSVQVAFTPSGEPTQALMGFLKAHNGDLSQIEIKTTPKGDYVFLKAFIPGKRTEEILPGILPDLIRSIKFEEGMRWIPGSNFKFIRPIRWILALYGSEVVKFSLENLQSDRYTFGHRIISPKRLEIAKVGDYLRVLKRNGVLASIDDRRRLINQRIEEILELEGVTYRDKSLVEDYLFLAESPVIFYTSFDEKYLSLPPELIESVIRIQQKFIPLYRDGRLTNLFIALKDGLNDHIDIAKIGAKRVVAARLFDAKYFLELDMRTPLDDYVEGLKGIIFHRDLGTFYDKTFRLQDLVKFILEMMGVNDEETLSNALRAAYLCKADLVTHTVGEFPELQGIVGKYLALHHKEPKSAAEAIAEHYMPRTADDEPPKTTIGIALALADRFDTLVGFASINILPKGTKDMYGLKRAVNQIIQITLERDLRIDIGKIVSFSYKLFTNYPSLKLSEDRVKDALFEAFSSRFEEQLKKSYPLDIIRGVAHLIWRDTWLGVRILKLLSDKRETQEFVKVAKLGVRLKNILKKVPKSELEEVTLREDLMDSEEERKLLAWLREQRESFEKAISMGALEKAYDMMLELADLVELFFQKVFVMVEDKDKRLNRLKLLRELDKVLMKFCDFSKVVV